MGHDHDHVPRAAANERTGASRALRAVLILSSAYMLAEVVGGLLTSSLALLADAGYMLSDVASLHDLHVWSITSGLDALSAHVIPLDDISHTELLEELEDAVSHQFGIGHVTIQIETEECAGLKHTV